MSDSGVDSEVQLGASNDDKAAVGNSDGEDEDELQLNLLVKASADLDSALNEGSDTAEQAELEQGVRRDVRETFEKFNVQKLEDFFERYRRYRPVAEDGISQPYRQAVADETCGDMLARHEPDNEQALSLLLRSGKALRTERAFHHAGNVFRKAAVRASHLALADKAAEAFRARMLCTEEGLRRRSPLKSLMYGGWRVSSNYGQSWLRWSLWVVVAILAFGVLYLPTPEWLPWSGSLRIDEPYSPAQSWFNAFFASTIALGLPGLGGVGPGNDSTKVMLLLNGLTGFLLVGVLATLLTQRLLNRN